MLACHGVSLLVAGIGFGCAEPLQQPAAESEPAVTKPEPDNTSGDDPQADSSALSAEQKLALAAFRLDVQRVKELLRAGADVDTPCGLDEREFFQDKWTRSWPMAAENWTPLLAVANSNRLPDPERPTRNTSADLKRAQQAAAEVDPEIIKARNERRIEIARALIEAGADLDLEDGHGATALYDSVYAGYEDLALLLIESGAEVNTKTGIYIDGTYDDTPLHRASDQPRVLKALLEGGADVSAKDSTGDTPLHWACRDGNLESVQALVKAGAEVDVPGEDGRRPIECLSLLVFPPDSPLSERDREAFRKLMRGSGQEEAIRSFLVESGARDLEPPDFSRDDP